MLCINPNTWVIISPLHWSLQRCGHVVDIYCLGLRWGGWRSFSVGFTSLEKQVVPDNSCWNQPEWSYHTCALNFYSPWASRRLSTPVVSSTVTTMGIQVRSAIVTPPWMSQYSWVIVDPHSHHYFSHHLQNVKSCLGFQGRLFLSTTSAQTDTLHCLEFHGPQKMCLMDFKDSLSVFQWCVNETSSKILHWNEMD